MRSTLAVFFALCLLLTGCTAAPPVSDASAFSHEEVAHIFSLTTDALFTAYGEPDVEQECSYHGMPASEFAYGENLYRTEVFSDCVFYVKLCDDTLPAPREITIGMPWQDAAACFMAEKDAETETLTEDTHYRILYGEYETTGNYGILFYEHSKPKLLEYSSEGCIFAMGIANGKIEYFEYFV